MNTYDAEVQKDYLGTVPVAVFVPASNRVTEKLGSKKVLLINADDSGGWEEFSPSESIVGMDERLPLVSFACVHQMLDNGEYSETMSALDDGLFKLLDFYPEEKRQLTAAQKEQLKKAKRKYKNRSAAPRNYGLTPPALGFSLVSQGIAGGRYTNVWHRTGATLFQFREKDYFLFGQDEGTYFGCELAGPAKTLDEAFMKLMPEEARDRKDAVRQGEWFALPVKEKDVPPIQECVLLGESNVGVYLPVLTEEDNRHEVEAMEMRVSKEGIVYYRGVDVRHDEHEILHVDGWCTFHRNTAKLSVSQQGVD